MENFEEECQLKGKKEKKKEKGKDQKSRHGQGSNLNPPTREE